jgi:hypothetical protein
VTKKARKVLGTLNAASLIMAGSLPLMGEDAKSKSCSGAKGCTAAKKSEQKTVKQKPKVADKQGAKSCSDKGKTSGQKR